MKNVCNILQVTDDGFLKDTLSAFSKGDYLIANDGSNNVLDRSVSTLNCKR